MRLKTKIILGFLAACLLLGGVGLYTLYTWRLLDHSAANLLATSSYAQLSQPLHAVQNSILAFIFLVGLSLLIFGLSLYKYNFTTATQHRQPTNRPATLAQVTAERDQLAGVVDALDEGLLVVDNNRRVIVANPVISRLLGVPADQLTGHTTDDLARHHPRVGQLLPYLDAPAAQRPPEAAALTLAQAGSEAQYRLLVSELLSFNEATGTTERVGSVLTLRNVSDYRQLDQAKWHFLTDVSQELHTPLALMQLSLQRLQDGKAGPLTPEQHNIAYTLTRENKHLLKLVHELLDVSQLELGTIQLNFQPARLHEIVQFVVATIRPQLQPKRLVLDVQVPTTLPLVRADIEKTTWVLLSLLANAIRYAHMQDTLHIYASILPDGRQVQVRVQDQGPGIAPELQEKIFQRFTQLPSQGGSGLGLSIAREFMASQGGQLWVESALGKGSTFIFTLPLGREGQLAA